MNAWPDPFRGDELAGQVCLITGAARGIGAAIAARLGELGGTVVVTDLDGEAADAKASELREAGHKASAYQLDVRSTEGVERVVASVNEELGPVDVLINNAGLFELTETINVPDEEWQLQVDVMLTGPFKLVRRVARDMLGRGAGSIVNTGSIGGFGGNPQRSAYNAAKAGVRILTECLAAEWAPHGVRVNSVAPAVTRTEILRGVIESAEGQIKVDEFAGRTPLGRLAEVDEIAEAVAYLASPRAAFVTGENLLVDGGWIVSDGFPLPRPATVSAGAQEAGR